MNDILDNILATAKSGQTFLRRYDGISAQTEANTDMAEYFGRIEAISLTMSVHPGNHDSMPHNRVIVLYKVI